MIEIELQAAMTIVDLLRPSVRILTASRRTVIMLADLPTLQRSPMPRRISSTGVTEYWIGTAASVCLDARKLDHLAPFLDFFDDQLAELGR